MSGGLDRGAFPFEGKELYRLMLDSLAQPLLAVDSNFKVIQANSAFCDIYGADVNHIRGMKCYEAVRKSDEICYCCRGPEAMRTGKPQSFQNIIDDGRGRKIIAGHGFYPLKDEEGLSYGFMEIMYDLPADLLLGSVLGQRESIIFQNAPECIFITDLDGRFTEVNPSTCEKLGYSPEILLRSSLFDYVVKDELGETRAYFEKILQDGQALFEFHHIRRNSRPELIEVSASMIDHEGLTALLCIGRHVTGRMGVDIDPGFHERRYRELVETVSQGYWLLDSDLTFTDTNEPFCRMLGYERSEIIGKSPIDFMDSDNWIKFFEHHSSMADERQHNFEISLIRKDGGPLYAYLNSTSMLSGTGKLVGSFAFITDITRQKEIEKKLKFDALHDPLTGLGNRTMCMDRIKQAQERVCRRKNLYCAVIYIDLDHFKIVNDSLSHSVGDQFIQEVGERLCKCVRGQDTVARLGGDEFVLILEDLVSPKEAIRVVKRFKRSLARPFVFGDHRLNITASFGIALSRDPDLKPEELIQNATIASHRAKEQGGDKMKVFTTEMREQVIQRVVMEADLRHALHKKEFVLHFQPIILLPQGGLMGFEALVRWNHPAKGLMPPSNFIPLAERTGLIHDLGIWVLWEACRTLSRWRATIQEAKDLIISINLSGRQFSQGNIVDHVTQVLKETKLPPAQLKLEITETAVMDNARTAAEKLMRLKNKGVKLCIDDFGTGYSSMSYLQKFPLDHLKVDLSFVEMMDKSQENFEIVKAIISMAHNLNLRVIAEGVETVEQLRLLHDMKCECIQGYLFSKPITESEAAAFITKFSKDKVVENFLDAGA